MNQLALNVHYIFSGHQDELVKSKTYFGKPLVPTLSTPFHTTVANQVDKRRSGRKGRRGDVDLTCPSCQSPFTEVELFEGNTIAGNM